MVTDTFTITFANVPKTRKEKNEFAKSINNLEGGDSSYLYCNNGWGTVTDAGQCPVCNKALECDFYYTYCGFSYFDQRKKWPEPVREEQRCVYCELCGSMLVVDPFSKPKITFGASHTSATFTFARVLKTLPAVEMTNLADQFETTRDLSDQELVDLYSFIAQHDRSFIETAEAATALATFGLQRRSEPKDDNQWDIDRLGWPVDSPAVFNYKTLCGNVCPFQATFDGVFNPMICFSPGLNDVFGFDVWGD